MYMHSGARSPFRACHKKHCMLLSTLPAAADYSCSFLLPTFRPISTIVYGLWEKWIDFVPQNEVQALSGMLRDTTTLGLDAAAMWIQDPLKDCVR